MPRLWPRVAALLIGWIVQSAAWGATPAVSLQTLLEEMTDRPRLAQLPHPTYEALQSSSYERKSRDPGQHATWSLNTDWSHFQDRIEVAGRTEWVMLDTQGPGAIVRIWSGGPKPKGVIRIYLDDAPEPVVELPTGQLLGGTGLVGEPLSAVKARGLNLYLPIPYQSRCRVTYDGPHHWQTRDNADRIWYIINHRRYAPGTVVRTFHRAQLVEARELLHRVGQALTQRAEPSGGASLQTGPRVQRTLQPGGSASFDLSGPAAISELTLQLRSVDLRTATRTTVLTLEFDGQKTVTCPIGDFFGSGVGVHPFSDWFRTVAPDGTMTSRWVMPFAKTSRVQVHNRGEKPVEIDMRARTMPWTWDDRSMHFHARWRMHAPVDAGQKKDWNFVALQGQGVYVGDTMAVFNPTHVWWGEGDERVYIDGEKLPSHMGTGTEDYYGYAWGSPQIFDAPFHAQPTAGDRQQGHITNTRVRVLDAIPFTRSLRLDMEVWRDFSVNYAVGAATYWYARPGVNVLEPAEDTQPKIVETQPPEQLPARHQRPRSPTTAPSPAPTPAPTTAPSSSLSPNAGIDTQTAAVTEGPRPYEMVWANRVEDTRAPLANFDEPEQWQVLAERAVARFEISTERFLWGLGSGVVSWTAQGSNAQVTLRPRAPIALPVNADCVSLWIYGNHVPGHPQQLPPVQVHVLLRSADQRSLRVPLGTIAFPEWFLLRRKLSESEAMVVRQGGVVEAIEITGLSGSTPQTLWLDNLNVYQEQRPPLSFAPRRQRGIDPFPGQSAGVHTGPGRLSFPNRPQTLLPENLVSRFDTTLEKVDSGYQWSYQGADGKLSYRFDPQQGLGTIRAQWHEPGRSVERRLDPLAEAGVLFWSARRQKAVKPESMMLLSARREGQSIRSTYRCVWEDGEATLQVDIQLWQKSLVIDLACAGGAVTEVAVGGVRGGGGSAKLVKFPYLTGGPGRPAVVQIGDADHPLFILAQLDHARSNASEFWFANRLEGKRAVGNGGSRYHPRTDGQRPDCFERLFLTVSPRVEEVLPSIANPPSPFRAEVGSGFWTPYAIRTTRQDALEFWRRVADLGVHRGIITGHENDWRDDYESYTFRTRAAPGKGGDQGLADYVRGLRELGFRVGLYTNYVDLAPVNEHWHEDWITRTSQDQWRSAWWRCWQAKPTRAVEAAMNLAPVLKAKYQPDAGYCDVHTALAPWRATDFDARVPGAGTFASAFYAYGELLEQQRTVFDGPILSEGGHHWYYAGLVDANGGHDLEYDFTTSPWLVDFALRRIHPLSATASMRPAVFFGIRRSLTAAEMTARHDQYLAAAVAFAHMPRSEPTDYFRLQPIAQASATSRVQRIRYADGQGKLWDTSLALGRDVHRRNQIAIDYDNGLRVRVNGHSRESWSVEGVTLPAMGWWVVGPGLVAFSGDWAGGRVDFVESPEFVYADGRGRMTDFGPLACDGPVVVRKQERSEPVVRALKPGVKARWIGGARRIGG